MQKNGDTLSDDALKDIDSEIDNLKKLISNGHSYIFIGKVGQFCPIKPGCGGGLLMREKDGKYYAATGSKGYRWLESEMVKQLGKEADIDRSYYDKLVDDAADNISKYGDLEWFISDDPYIPQHKNLDDLPWSMECGQESCLNCPNFEVSGDQMNCKQGYNISDLEILNADNPFDVR